VREIVRTNDAVLVSAVGALLDGAGIPHLVLDQNMSVLEGSLGILPRRVLVAEDYAAAARHLLQDAGLAKELRPDPSDAVDVADTTLDAVLGGRLTLRQPKRGHRVGHDAILLAAATDAKAGEHAVDLGAGVGAAGLAVARRVPLLTMTLVDIDPVLCALARENAQTNGLGDRVEALALDVAISGAFDAAGLNAGSVDRVLMNPPFNDPARQQTSPDAGRARAHMAEPATLTLWINTAARLLKPEGVLTLIWRADGLNDVLDALTGFGSIGVMPVHPRPDAPAIRVLVSAVKGSRVPLALRPPLILNEADGKPSTAAEAVLRSAETLRLSEA
jgi:tRNA1(Val) A37 N6-methylase TrmN6